jgi:vacuolar-type H+-ATPase subunit H
MSGETEKAVSGWTVDTLKALSDEREQHHRELRQSEDRRYAEVNVEKEKALKIKEEADKVALTLAKQIQDYKDEKANNLRDQILSTEAKYATKADLETAEQKFNLALRPVLDYVQNQQGGAAVISQARGQSNFVLSQWISVIGVAVLVLLDLRTRGVI